MNEPGAGRGDRRREIGLLGEDLAAAYVLGRGWRVLQRNWRTRYGELDLIAADGDTLVVVEVKTRAARSFPDPAAAVTPRKLAQMRSLARQWLAQQGGGWPGVRFDVIAVRLDQREPADTDRAQVRHLVGVSA